MQYENDSWNVYFASFVFTLLFPSLVNSSVKIFETAHVIIQKRFSRSIEKIIQSIMIYQKISTQALIEGESDMVMRNVK